MAKKTSRKPEIPADYYCQKCGKGMDEPVELCDDCAGDEDDPDNDPVETWESDASRGR